MDSPGKMSSLFIKSFGIIRIIHFEYFCLVFLVSFSPLEEISGITIQTLKFIKILGRLELKHNHENNSDFIYIQLSPLEAYYL